MAFAALWLWSPGVYASEPGFQIRRPYGTGHDDTQSVALGDLNGDGALDIVADNSNKFGIGQGFVYLNDGAGGFATGQPFVPSDYDIQSLALGDLNGDGALDIVVGNNGPDFVYLNDGAGSFAVGQPYGLNDNTQSVALGDLNGDGALDIVAGNNGPDFFYFNDGVGGFAVGQPFDPSDDNTSRVVLGDLNGDGALDIVIGGQNVIYLNDGAGGFAARQPFDSSDDNTQSVALGDLNGDGALDIVIGNNGQSFFYLNEGAGSFAVGQPYSVGDSTQSVALGDLNGDGALDIVAGNNGQCFFYLNEGAGSFTSGQPFGPGGNNNTQSVAVGDLNGDGALDIVAGNFTQDYVYLNDGIGGFVARYPLDTFNAPAIQSVALGDLNGDGTLDIVAGNQGPDFFYFNDGGGGFGAGQLLGLGDDQTYSVALGDLNGDGTLDIVAGNQGQDFFYLNDGTGSFAARQPFDLSDNSTSSVALGDLNGDGALDIVAGNQGQDFFYLNDGTGSFAARQPFGPDDDNTSSVALGDLNGDGTLDIVVGNQGQDFVYLNDGAGGFTSGRSLGPSNDETQSVALGDLNGDGALDILAGNSNFFVEIGQNLIYLNDGAGGFAAGQPFGLDYYDDTLSVALGDLNGDSTLDIVVGKQFGQNLIYLNNGPGGFADGQPFGLSDNSTRSMALGDLNGDGAIDIVVGNNRHQSFVYLQATRSPLLTITRPGPTANANFYSTPVLHDSRVISIPFTLCHVAGSHIGRVAAFYSLDGGGNWREAIAATGAKTTNLPASAKNVGGNPCPLPAAHHGSFHTPVAPVAYHYPWDTFASGFFGQSDNVVIRMVAYAQPRSTTLAPAGAYRYTNSVAGPYQWPAASAVTFPFRVRGAQVQVISPATPANGLAGALVYRLPANQLEGAQPIGRGGVPWRTDARGFLAGRGEVRVGDRLVALWPVPQPPLSGAASHNATQLFYTNITPTISALETFTVTAAGVQPLTISAQKPLLLFTPTIALEWNAAADLLYQRQLERALQQTSALLFDWTNGQAALGEVTVYHNAPLVPPRAADGWQPWRDADIRIYANNRLRPNADIGGVVITTTMDASDPGITYQPGQIRMPALWNRYGAAGDDTNDDWARALAHELGHYLFFLEDNYLGLDAAGRLVDETACPGVMSDPFREDASEFHPQAGWETHCARTLAAQTTGRADWQTIRAFYPALFAPEPSALISEVLAGPNSLPLALTTVRMVTMTESAAPLPNPLFNLVQEGGGPLAAEARGRAFLFQDERLVDLGGPSAGQVLARGARPGDRLCVYAFAPATIRLGCEQLAPGDNQLTLHPVDDWRPNLAVQQIEHGGGSYSVTVSVSGVAPQSLQARFYPLGASASSTVTVASNGLVTFNLAEPPVAGFIRLWQVGASPLREVVSDFSVGGAPCCRISGSRAPMVSNDGQVLLYLKPDTRLPEGEFYTLQALAAIPNAPTWTTSVGQAYHLTKSAGAPGFAQLSINFQYLDREAPPGEERFLRPYFSADNGAHWQLIEDATVNRALNSVSAPAQGAGLYALMSSYEIALTPGWNNIAYPVVASRAVRAALASIPNAYSVVYHLTPGGGGGADSWQVYSPDAPDWGNDLTEFTFGQGYLIYATQPVTLYLKGAGVESVTAAASLAPPATYFITATTPVAIQAWVDGVVCGVGQAATGADGQLAGYRVKVADGCGSFAANRTVTFTADGAPLGGAMTWNNTRAQHAPFTPDTPAAEQRLFLPLVDR